MSSLIEAMVEGLRQTAPFQSLPAMTRPQDELWHALNNTLLQLRQPLYHQYLHKAVPTGKNYDAAIQSGLAILHVYAANTGTRQAIVRLKNGRTDAISFQPRPFGANWTAQHLLQPEALLDPDKDPLSGAGGLPELSRETQRNYIRDVDRFATFLGRSPDTATTDDVRRFQIEQHMPACRRQP